MKTIVFVRHAKSNHDNPQGSDFERILNARGDRDAKLLAGIFARKFLKPDLILSSSAKRAAETCKYFAEALGYDADRIEYDRGVYDRGSRYIIKRLTLLDDNLSSIIVFGHNPDMTTLYSYFSGEYIDNIPTCGVFCIDIEIDSWKEIEEKNGKIRFFDYPKIYFSNDSGLLD